MLLAGCDPSDRPQIPPDTKLPALPADIVGCFEAEGVEIPDRPITAGEAERLWKADRRMAAVYRRCGKRLIAWYGGLQKGWR